MASRGLRIAAEKARHKAEEDHLYQKMVFARDEAVRVYESAIDVAYEKHLAAYALISKETK